MTEAFRWASAERGEEPPADAYCRTRDIAVARLDTLRSLAEQSGALPDTAALVAAITGELANNCFDHNLGAWRDVPGCWFSKDISEGKLVVIVADRGQGFLGSLRRVKPDLRDAAEAIHLAFTTDISGRAPEQRGKGLLFVLDALAALAGTAFTLHTGNARIVFDSPVTPDRLPHAIQPAEVTVPGTYAALTIPDIRRIVATL